MADPSPLALGLGLMPFVALALYSAATAIASRQHVVWGVLLGILAFLGLSHAMATVLFNHPLLTISSGPVVAMGTMAAGLACGLALGGWLLARGVPSGVSRPSRVAWTSAAFLAFHSVSDGLVLGQAYVGPQGPAIDLNALIVGGTIVHRFAEGALVVVPAFVAAWKPEKTFAALFAGLLTVPAALLPGALSGAMPLGVAFTSSYAISTLVAGAEAGLALMLLFIGFVPRAMASRGLRWAAWAGLGFLAIAFLHGLVE